MKSKYAFISYSTKNLSDAQIVRDVLTQMGITCWMAPDSIPGGSNYTTEIFDAISDCFVFVLLLSQDSMQSGYVSKEVDLAVSNRRYIIPIRLDDEQPTKAFRFYLCDVQTIPLNGTIRETARSIGDFIIQRSNSAAVRQFRLAQKYEKPSFQVQFDQDSLNKLDQLFQMNNIVCVTGMGGMGKSVLVKAYIKSLMDRKQVETVSYNDCPDSVRQAIAMIPMEGIEDEELLGENAATTSMGDVLSVLYEKKLAYLQTLDMNTLLVFDGLNQLDYDGLEVLNRLNCKVIVTTRFHFGEYPELRMEDLMTFDKQKALFLQFYEDFSESPEDEEYVEKIIQGIGGHILTIKLIALFLNTTGMLPKELYQKLISKGSITWNSKEKIAYKNTNQTIEDHISGLFRMTELATEELQILRKLSFIPTTGIPKRQFRLWMPEGTMLFVDQLIKKGWVQNNKGVIGLHPIVHSVIRKNRPEKLEEFSDFFDALIDSLNMRKMDSIPQRQNAAFLCEYLASEVNESSLLGCRLCLAIGSYLNHYAYWLLYGARDTRQYTFFTQARNIEKKFQDRFSLAVSCLKKGIDICDDCGFSNPQGLRARLYSNLGAALYNMRSFPEAAGFHRKALALRTEELGAVHPKTVTSRRRLGTTCMDMSDFDTAFACYNENLKLITETSENPVEISKAYYDCGKVFVLGGKLNAALPYLRSAVKEMDRAEKDKVDTFGAAQLYYITAMIMSELNKEDKSENMKTEILSLLQKAEGYTCQLESVAGDELHRLTKELQESLTGEG